MEFPNFNDTNSFNNLKNQSKQNSFWSSLVSLSPGAPADDAVHVVPPFHTAVHRNGHAHTNGDTVHHSQSLLNPLGEFFARISRYITLCVRRCCRVTCTAHAASAPTRVYGISKDTSNSSDGEKRFLGATAPPRPISPRKNTNETHSSDSPPYLPSGPSKMLTNSLTINFTNGQRKPVRDLPV